MMKRLGKQFVFDVKREVLRNQSFLFFSVLMPAGFYLLFTKVMISGTKSEMRGFAMSYMGSMVVYSGLISAFFGITALMMRDRKTGYLTRLSLSPTGLLPYYVSIGLLFVLINFAAFAVIGLLAVVLNGVNLTFLQWAWIVVIGLIGQVPLLIIGTMLSHLKREETLSVASNLLTFPMAIISGLWWPLSMLPRWVQIIGKLMPTYMTNHLLTAVMTNGKINGSDVIGLLAWILVTLAAVAIQIQMEKRWQHESNFA